MAAGRQPPTSVKAALPRYFSTSASRSARAAQQGVGVRAEQQASRRIWGEPGVGLAPFFLQLARRRVADLPDHDAPG
ncbi:MAG TPA: hypothetical protein VN748_12500 [Pseudonocardiaceae bacterium]|nr:hypothetical protein [Pseudonocardiaceae bacterium]